MTDVPRVGTGVFVRKERCILMGKRKNVHGHGSWSLPGGHLEFGESWEECARREVLEETNVQIEKIRFAAVTNDVFHQERRHYCTIFLVADHLRGDPLMMEPEKCDAWAWVPWDEAPLPTPLFQPLRDLLQQGFSPFA